MKEKVFGIIFALFMMLVLIGCPPDDPEEKKGNGNGNGTENGNGNRDRDKERTEENSMVFVDNPSNPGREFVIYDDLEFNVEFFEAFFDILEEEYGEDQVEQLKGMHFAPGLIVFGVMYTDDTWKNETIIGTAKDMSSSDPELTELFESMDIAVDLELKYTKDADGEIAAVDVVFSDSERNKELFFAPLLEILMGGTYYRKSSP